LGIREYGHGGGETDRRMLLKARLRANQGHLLHDSSHGEQGQCEKQLLYSHPKEVKALRREPKQRQITSHETSTIY